MSNWDQFGDWIGTVAVASFAWVSSVVVPDGATALLPVVSSPAPVENDLSSVMRWAQQEEDPPIEQVGEDSGEDVETLDEAPPPEDELGTADDTELLDQAPPVDVQDEDIELLDQGSPPATATDSPAPAPVTTVPVTSYAAPVAASGPVLPEGFGTGDVHVATGSAGFPVGLEDCHVGAVTGRAYVGIDCGEGDGSSFVGHAPSFEEFPFVLDESFPFGQESVFADRGSSRIENEVLALIATARGAPLDDEAAPEIRASGASSVAFEQRARDRKPRVETINGRAKRSKEARQDRNAAVTNFEAKDGGGGTSAESKQKKKEATDGASGKKEKKSKQKKQAENKGKKRRTR